MTVDEAKQALFNQRKIRFQGAIYEKITALIFRVDDKGKLIQSVEMVDKNSRTVVIALIKEIEYDNI